MLEQMSAEAVVLHRVIEGNMREAKNQLRDFLPGELEDLKQASRQVIWAIEDVQRNAERP